MQRNEGGLGPQERVEVTLDLEPHDPGEVQKSLAALFGRLSKGDVGERAKRLHELQPEITAWLNASQENTDAFIQDPLGVLAKQFPEIGLHPGRAVMIPERIRFRPKVPEGPDPIVAEIFQKVWQHLATSEANATEFRQTPLAVIASLGAGYPAEKVDQVQRAFEAVLGIYRLGDITPEVGFLSVLNEWRTRGVNR